MKLSAEGKVQWDETFGTYKEDVVNNVIETASGNFIAAGYTKSKGQGMADAWVFQFNSIGMLEWEKTYGGAEDDVCRRMIQTNDESIVICGWTYSKGNGAADVWVMKLDKTGELVWEHTYGGKGYDMAGAIAQTTDNGFIVAGQTGSKGNGLGDFWVLKLDDKGVLQWEGTYGGRNSEVATGVVQNSAGDYIVSGYTYSKGNGSADYWVVVLDEQGKLKRDQTFGDEEMNRLCCLSLTTAGNYLLAGNVENSKRINDLWLIKTDPAGSATGSPGESNTDEIRLSEKQAETITGTEVEEIFKADIDINIPKNSILSTSTFALIIGNEDYFNNQPYLNEEQNVKYALNDARTFSQYVNQTLGVPNDNIHLLENAGATTISHELDWIYRMSMSQAGDAQIIFYYAGHGLTDGAGVPYIMPVDISADNLSYALNLHDLETKLTEYPTDRVSIFLDACFSGGARGESLALDKENRITPKVMPFADNVIIFTAASDHESNSYYEEKNHGMFTYYMLKILQKNKGDVNYSEFIDYLKYEIPTKSAAVNKHAQNPAVYSGNTNVSVWGGWGFLDN